MGRADRVERAIEAAAAMRLAAAALDDPRAAQRLRRAERLVLRDVGPSVPKGRAARLLGVSTTALQRWIQSGRLPAVRRPRGRAHDVEFIVIGGFALGFHGVVRATKDVDIVPNPGEESLTRLWHALEEIDAQPQGLEDCRPGEMPVEWSLEGLIAGRGNWIVHTRHGRLDVMQWVEPFDSYDELRANAIEVDVEEIGAAILVAGFDDLIAMKETAGRDQDRLDVTALRMAHGLEE